MSAEIPDAVIQQPLPPRRFGGTLIRVLTVGALGFAPEAAIGAAEVFAAAPAFADGDRATAIEDACDPNSGATIKINLTGVSPTGRTTTVGIKLTAEDGTVLEDGQQFANSDTSGNYNITSAEHVVSAADTQVTAQAVNPNSSGGQEETYGPPTDATLVPCDVTTTPPTPHDKLTGSFDKPGSTNKPEDCDDRTLGVTVQNAGDADGAATGHEKITDTTTGKVVADKDFIVPVTAGDTQTVNLFGFTVGHTYTYNASLNNDRAKPQQIASASGSVADCKPVQSTAPSSPHNGTSASTVVPPTNGNNQGQGPKNPGNSEAAVLPQPSADVSTHSLRIDTSDLGAGQENGGVSTTLLLIALAGGTAILGGGAVAYKVSGSARYGK